MRKIALFGLFLVAGLSISAQNTLKEAERDVKAGKYDDAMLKLKPAFTAPETAGLAQTWYLAGKAGMDYYQDQFLQKQVGKEVNAPKMSHALIDSYGYLIKALPLDSVPDAKGKVKPKYSKDIIKMLNERYNDYNNAAVFLWEAKDYQGAYDAWEIVLDMPHASVLGANAPKALPDSTINDVMYNQGLAAWQMDSLALSLRAFERAIANGYDKAQIYDYAINHAARLNNNEKVYALAEDAYKKFGNENPLYLQLMINGRIEKKQYDEANKMLDEAISIDPKNAQLYNIKGILYESMKDNEKARECYKNASEIDPKQSQAQYNYGRMLCNEAYEIADKADKEANMSQAEYSKIRSEKIDPLFREAATHLEAALAIEPDNRDIITYLRNVYYNLGDEENLKRIESM